MSFRPSWISEENDFSNSKSPCHSDASHKFQLYPTNGLEELSFEEFQHGGHLGYQNETILAVLNVYVTPMPPIKFRLNRTFGLEKDVV